MPSVSDRLQSLITSLQENSLFNDISFVSAFNRDTVTRPVSAPICAVGTGSAEIRSSLYAYQTFELNIYSPLSQGGSACQNYLDRLANFILADTNGVFEITIGGVEYNSHMIAFTSKMIVKCNVNVSSQNTVPSGNTAEVTINSSVFAAENCIVTEKTRYKNVYTLWNSQPKDSLYDSSEYVIELGGFEASVARAVADLGVFTLYFDGALYSGCRFTEVVYDMNSNLVTKALIVAYERQVSYG